MPGFFDFTDPMGQDPMANSPMLEDVDTGGGMGGGYDFSQNIPQAAPQRPSQVPYDALTAMNGIEMPQMPMQDSMGRYGVTEDQQRGAGYQSLAAILQGAAGTMFNDRPDDVLKGAAASGDIRRGALDKASQENIAAFKLKVEAKAKELDFISKKTDIQKQQMAIDAEAMKMEELHLKRQVAVAWGEEMAPVMTNTLKMAANAYGPEKAAVVKSGFLHAQSKLAAGDLEGAENSFNETMKTLPSQWAIDAKEAMAKATIGAANKYQLSSDIIKDPAMQQLVKEVGGEMTLGKDGSVEFLGKNDIAMIKLKELEMQSQIEQNRAQTSYYNNRPPAGSNTGTLTEKEVGDSLAKAEAAVNTLLSPTGGLKTAADAEKRKGVESKALGDLARFGLVNPNRQQLEEFRMMPAEQRKQLLMQSLSRNGGGAQVGSPRSAVEQQMGAAANPMQAFRSAAGGNAVQKGTALAAMSKSPGTAAMVADAKKQLGLTGKPKDEAQAAQWTELLYTFIAARNAK